MRKTKELLLAGTMIPVLIGAGPGFAAPAPGTIVVAQAEPGAPNGEERKHPAPGQPGAPARPAPEAQHPAAAPHPAEPAAPRQAAPEAPRPAAPKPAEAPPVHQAPPAAPKPAAPAPRAEEPPAARQPAPRAAEPEAKPQRPEPKPVAAEPAPQHAAPKAAEPEAAPQRPAPKGAEPQAAPQRPAQKAAEPEAAPQRAAPKAAEPETAPQRPTPKAAESEAVQPGHAAPAVKAVTPPATAPAEPAKPEAAPQAPAAPATPHAGAPDANGAKPARGEIRRDAVPNNQPSAPNAAAPAPQQPGEARPAAGQPAAAAPAQQAPAAAPAPAPSAAPAQPNAAQPPAQGSTRPAAAPPAPPPPPPPAPAAPQGATPQGAVPQGAAPQGAPGQQQGQRRDRNNNGAIVGAAAGFVGGFLAAQAVQNFNQVRADRQVFTDNGVNIIREPGRTIVEQDDTYYIAHDENERFRDLGYDLNVRQADGYEVASYVARDGSSIYTYTDAQGRLVRRVREYPDGRNIILIDNRYTRYDRNFVDDVVTLPPPPPADLPPPDRYIVDAAEAPPALVYDTLAAPPVAPLPRRYTLDQIRYSPDVRSRMRSVDLNTITFATGSWTVSPDQAQKLASIAGAINAAIRRDPKEIYMVEGYTDATGNPTDNLSLSDRRAQSVATILTRDFQVPPENLVTQGYGAQFLKVQTQGPSVENRRVAVRRITPLLNQSATGQ